MGAFIGIPQMIAALGSIVTTGAVALLINFTELGRALRATADSNRLLQSSLQAVRLTEAG
jgi:branched-subunit amino acid ABC-type transport system permease component